MFAAALQFWLFAAPAIRRRFLAGFIALLVLWARAILGGMRRLRADYPLALGCAIALLIFLWPLRPSMSFFSNWSGAMFWLILGLTLALTAPGGKRPRPPA